MKKEIKNSLIGLILLVLSSCQPIKGDLRSINLEEWNEFTLQSIENSCNISKNDYNKIQNAPSKFIILGNHKFHTIKEQIEFYLSNRKQLLEKIVNENIVYDNQVMVNEIYLSDKAVYIVKGKGDNYYSFCLDETNQLEAFCLTNPELENYKDDFEINDVACINAIESHLSRLQIITLIDLSNKKPEYTLKHTWLY